MSFVEQMTELYARLSALPSEQSSASSLQLCLLACVLGWLLASKSNENLVLRHFWRKVSWYASGVWFMAFSGDNKRIGVKYCVDSDTIKKLQTKSKTIIFMRHGESDWNHVFNKGINLSLIVRLCLALLRETYLFLSLDSVFIDSPLNEDGFEQAKKLAEFIFDKSRSNSVTNIEHYLSILRGDGVATSVIVSSNLRRAISTTTVALWNRIERTGEKLVILASLQEISRNIDTQALSYARSLPDLNRLAHFVGGEKKPFDPPRVFDVSAYSGSKSMQFNGAKRMRAFNEWVFERPEEAVVVGGHSLWFKYYFQTHLPKSSDHEAKRLKITNSGVVAFTLWRADGADGMPVSVGGEIVYRIEPTSVVTVYGGFTSK